MLLKKKATNLYKKFMILMTTGLIVFNVSTSALAASKEEQLSFNKKVLENNTSYPAVLSYYLEMDKEIDIQMRGYSKAIEKKAIEITDNLATDYEKSKAIHDWVATNLWYDYDYYENRSGSVSDNFYASSVYKNKAAVCEGFAVLTMNMHRAVGIPCKIINGVAVSGSTSGFHNWNEVFVGNRWIIVDSTWDCNNVYRYGEFSEKLSCDSDYFDPNIELFSEKHKYQFIDYVTYTGAYFNPGKDKTVIIPEGYTDLAYNLFSGNFIVKKIILPDTIRAIKYDTFRECYNLQEIRLSSILKVIPNYAFHSCYKLKEIVIPESVTKIGDYAFAGCDSLTKIVIPESVKKIGKEAFGKVLAEGDGFSETHSPKNLIIYGTKNSAAHKYALKYKIKFKEI